MGIIDLSTSYLGLMLDSPFIAGASPLSGNLDSVRRLEDAGCAAIVLPSLFEEQITHHETGRIHQMDPLDPRFERVIANFPQAKDYPLSPSGYLEHLRRIKGAVHIPVIGSLNGNSPQHWLSFAQEIEQAGADALELNVYNVVTGGNESAMAVEGHLRQMVKDVRSAITIPVSVKLSPFYTAFASVARMLTTAGANGLVIFNRFLQPDIDVTHMTVWPRLELSDSSELRLRLRWLAILRGQLQCSLGATGGVATPEDGIKAILAGADAVHLVSAILRHGPRYFGAMRDGLRQWMESMDIAGLDSVRGRLSLTDSETPEAFERGQYLQTLSSWRSWLGYQAYVEAHKDDEPKPPS